MNPLSFSIGVKDEASKQIEAINKELNNLVSKLDSIKNIAISLGGDPGEAESLMKSLNGVAASLANITKLSPEAQAASDRLTDSQNKLNAAMEQYNNLLAKIKSVNPTQVSEAFQKATKAAQSSMGVNFDRTAPGKFGDLSGLDPTKWAEHLKQYLHKSLDTEQIEVNVRRLIANIRSIMSSELSGLYKGPSLAPILEESFNFNSVNEKLNNAFRILREEFIKGMKQIQEVESSQKGLGLVENVLPGLKAQVEAAQKEFDALKNATSSTPVNPEAFKGAEGAIAATNEATKMLGEAINKLDFSKINTALDQLAERLNKLITELEGIEERMKTAFTGALEANVKSLGDVIDGLAKKMSAMSTPMSDGMKQGEQATRGQTDAAKSLSEVLQELSQKYKHTAEQAQKLAELASGDKLTIGGVQRDLKVGYNQATDIVETINALNKLSQAEQQQAQVAQQTSNAELEALRKKEESILSTIAYLKQEDEEYQKVAKSVQKVHDLIRNIQDARTVNVPGSGGLLSFVSGRDDMSKEKVAGDMKTFLHSVRYMQEELKAAVSIDSLANRPDEQFRNLVNAIKEEVNNLRTSLTYAKKLLKDNLGTDMEGDIQKKIALLEELKSSYQKAYSVLNKHGGSFYDNHNGDMASEELIAAKKSLDAVQKQIAEKEKLASTNKTVEQTEKDFGQTAQQTAEQIQKLAQSAVTEAFKQLAKSLEKIKELFDNLGKAEGLTQLNNTINGVNTAVEALAKTLSNVNNAVKFTGSTEEIASYEAKVKSLQEQVAALEAKAKGLGETAKAASEQVKTVTASGGGGGSSKDGLTDAQLKRVNDQLEILQKRLNTIEPNYNKAKEFGFPDEVIQGKINHLHAYMDALNEAVKAGSYSGIKVGKYSLFSKAANEDIPTQAQAQKMAKQMQEYIAIQQQAQAEAERQAQAQERMRQAAEAAGMSIVKAGEQTQSAGQKSEGAKQQMHGFNEEILVNMRSWEKAGEMMAIFEKRIFAVMAQLQSGKALGFDTGNLQNDIQELMRFYAIMKEIRNNYGFAEIEGAMLTTSKVLKESGLDFGKMWEKNKQELTAVKTIYEQMTRLQALANNKNALPTDNLNIKYQREALENALRAQDIMAKLKSVDLRQATALVGGQDYQQATAAIEAFFRTYNKNANIATSQTAELQRLLEKIQGTDKGGGWINVMKNAGVSEDKINEMRQIAEKIQRAIAALEQSRQMGTAANFVQSDWYRATVVEGKKASDTGYLAVREAHERAAAEREASKATQESAKAAEKKREEMSKAWREQEAARQKEAAAAEASLQKQMAAEEKARQKSIEDAWKAADQKIKADQHAAQERERANQQATKEEIKGYEQAVKAEYAKERAMSKRFAAEQEAARKAQQEKDKLYGAAGLRENDPGLQNMTAQLDALMQKITKVRGDIEATRDFISRGNRGEQDYGLEQLRALEQEVNTLMRQYEALYQTRAALSAQVPFAETQRSVKNVELEQLGEKYRQEAKAADEAAQAKKRDTENSMAAGKAISDLQLKIDKYNKSQTFQKANELKIDTSDYERAIKRLERYKQLLEYIKSDAGKHHNPSLITGIGSSAENDVKRAEIALKKLVTEKQQAASAAQQLASEQQRLAQALNQTTEHARGQSQVLSDLKMMATQYLGVWGGQQFLHNIIEIGGQLEMQRMSIGAILQNQSQANDLFEKIKALAVQSPFGVVELDQMTKQLTAYGFKYSELYDMTKRLADISAATGTGVDRLALALGHVRSEAALSGYTLRQFSMGNVPLLQKLSEKLGKTTAEIRKMVRTKDISYEDVEGVIKDLTNEGGMFYNMQEVISESVKARFKNVKDSMAIMYGEMAEGGVGDALKAVADALMDVTKNWKDVATVVGTGAAVWGIQRAAIMLNTKAIGANSAATLSSINAHIRREGILLSESAAYRSLSAAEMQTLLASRAYNVQTLLRIALGKKLTVEQLRQIVAQKQMRVNALALAISTKKLTAEELSHMVAMGKVSKETAILAIKQAGLKANVQSASIAMIEQTRVLTLGQKAAMAASTAVKTLGAAFKSFAPMLLITGIIEAFQRVEQMKDRAEELGRDIMQMSQDNLKSARTMMGETGIQAVQKINGKEIDVTNVFGTELEPEKTILIKPEFDYEEAQGIIDKWAQYIREKSATPNKMLNNALLDEHDNVRSLQEQYDRLFDSMQEVLRAQEILSNTNYPLIFEAAQLNTSDGWWDDDVVDDASDYIKTRKELIQQVTKLSRLYPSETKKVIDAARREDSAFATATKGMSSYNDMLIKLIESKEEFSRAGEILSDALYTPVTDTDKAVAYLDATTAAKQHTVKQAELDNEIDDYIASIKTAFSGVDISPAIQQALMKSFKMALEKMNLPKDLIDKYLGNFADAIGAEMDDAQEKQIKRLADWQKRAGKVFEVNKEIKVKTKTITSIDEFAQEVQKDLKEKQEYITRNASHIRQTLTINAGIKFNLDKLDTKSLNNMIIELGTRVQSLLLKGKVDAAQTLNSVIQDELLPFRDALASIDENKKWLKQEGYPEKDPTKDKSKNKTGSKEDKNAKAVRERVRVLKEAADAFEYWDKKLGPKGAWARVNEQFGDVLSKIGVTIDNIKDLRGHLKAVSNSKEYKAIKDQKVKLEIDKEIAKELDQLNRKVFEKSIDEYKSKFTKMLDDLTRKWETFNTVRQATGNKALAFDLAGISQQDRDMRNAAEALRRKLIEEMRNVGGEGIIASIPLDVYIDEEKLRDQFKDALGDDNEQAMKIDGLVEAYKRWQKAQQDVTKADIDAYAKIIGSTVDYASRIDRINDKLEQEKENIKALVSLYAKSGGKEGISQGDADIADAIATAKANFDKLKEGSDYINLMNRSLSMTKGEVTAAAAAIEGSLNERLAVGVIKAEEYATEMKKLHDIVAQFDENSLFGNNSALTSFLHGGLKGGQSFVNDRIVSLTIKGNQEGLSEEEQNELESLVKLRKKLDSVVAKLSNFAAVTQIVTGALEGFQKAAQSLSDMFDALGKEGPASLWSDIADGIGAVSNIFAPVNNLVQNALSGNVGGLLSSAISAPVDMIAGPITAFAKLHDKRLERAIERLRDDVQAIEANTELIARSRERTLGYDMGDVRRQMAQQYAPQSYGGSGIMAYINAMLNGSQQNKSMFDYYSQNSQGTGYQQEYDNLIEQREKYLEILKDQQDKKKKSNDEIEETKAKIAELDDQIAYFSQDLAKELWSIDIKGWADQLSDALASAFENGENMAKAYKDTVTSILQQMMQKMMQMQILEPMFANLQKDLFGENGKGGVFDPSNPKGSMSKVTKIIGDYFGKGGEGEKAITASMEFMTAFERAMQNAGLTVLNEASNTLSSSMQGTTEETSGLLAGYVNALRQDVSVNRILLTQFVSQMWPDYIETFASQVTAVQNIDTNVQIIMTMMQTGNGAMFNEIAAMRARIDNVVMGIDKFSIR